VSEFFDIRAISIEADWQTSILHGAILMANRFLRWDKSTSDDVVGYQILFKKDSPPVDGDAAVTVGDVDVLDLTTVPALSNADGLYHFSVRSIDDVGMKGEHARTSGPLDFVAPAPATNVRLSEA
jgi:hypothetical protein